ncbi:uncharacterized protein FOMMEDRAFT_32484 [Fomitiporia mediterranea MF3/22]|uniref:Uncharacterized protein n=1 Tax=Fomitiporia mediterranea (strain MF3/22) TaxID=694068 RepID=R7SGI9_FOMME|nr:uncharacterized protein FOMMEDRAFT_32484 [Fomitiporia mediterranea MF3/22]EJC97540.1 hypothetical protein FOMMEDRAFT_32484 [Fomitiporia mediterranea MF3/22]
MFFHAFNVYLEILQCIEEALDRRKYPTLISQYKDMCPCCVAEQPDKEKLDFKMLVKKHSERILEPIQNRSSTVDSGTTDGMEHTGLSASGSTIDEEGSLVDSVTEKTPCTDCWTNLSADSKKKIVVLLICDMIQSGELAKYLLALTGQLMEVFGDNLMWHLQYIDGTGLEDFEGCEQVFSESNRVASITCHTSKFHCKQTILQHFTWWNSDKFTELSRFIMNNYRQALYNTESLTIELTRAKTELGIDSDNDFLKWHTEEEMYLKALKSGKPSKTEELEQQYVSLLKRHSDAKAFYNAQLTEWVCLSPKDFRAGNGHIGKLHITDWWTPDSSDWKRVDKSLAKCLYDKAIDKLEGEVMARLFELAKMNQAGTRYKQRHYISKGIKARSKTVMATVKSYNDAATQLGLLSLKVSIVLKYIFIGQFDILCLGCLQVDQKPWMLHMYIIQSEVKMEQEIIDLECCDPLLAMQLKKQHALCWAVN